MTSASPKNSVDTFSMRLDLVDLETFLAVVQTGSFSAAAQRMHISQPSVTSRIQKLEGILRTKLLVRTTRHVHTNPDGERLAREAEALLSNMHTLVQEFRQKAEAARNRVSLSVTPMLAAVVLPDIIQSYKQRYTDVEIHVMDLRHPLALSAVEAGDVDFGIMAPESLGATCAFELLYEEDMVLVVPSGHALAGKASVTMAEVATQPLMILKQYSELRAAVQDAFLHLNLDFNPAMEPSSLNTLLALVDAGVGVTFLPPSMANFQSTRRLTIPVSDLGVSRKFGIVSKRKFEPNSAVESFCQYLRDHVKPT